MYIFFGTHLHFIFCSINFDKVRESSICRTKLIIPFAFDSNRLYFIYLNESIETQTWWSFCGDFDLLPKTLMSFSTEKTSHSGIFLMIQEVTSKRMSLASRRQKKKTNKKKKKTVLQINVIGFQSSKPNQNPLHEGKKSVEHKHYFFRFWLVFKV